MSEYMHGVKKSEEGWARFRERTGKGLHARRQKMEALPAAIRVRGKVRRRGYVDARV